MNEFHCLDFGFQLSDICRTTIRQEYFAIIENNREFVKMEKKYLKNKY